MIDKNDVRNAFMEQYPTLKKYVDGVGEVTLTDDEYTDMIESWVDMFEVERLRMIRVERDGLLADSDWTQMPDAPVDRDTWAEYRQALRDFPETLTTFELLENPMWPTPPE